MDSTALTSPADDSAGPGLKQLPTGTAGPDQITGAGLPRAEDGIGAGAGEQWELVLYVARGAPKGLIAIDNLRRACEAHVAGRYSIEIVDVLEDPRRAVADRIMASPAVIRRLPKPVRKILGDLSDSDRLVVALELRR
jgi:circadian clock protein KaiB